MQSNEVVLITIDQLTEELTEQESNVWTEQNTSAVIDKIFNKDQLYKHCMYCGMIYDQEWKTKMYQNGKSGLGREFNDFNISTGVGPCCMHVYNRQLEEVQNFKP